MPTGPERQLSGALVLDGRRSTFTVRPATGNAGLFVLAHTTRHERGHHRHGWIRLADGTVRGTDVRPMQDVKPVTPRCSETGSDL